VKRELAEATKDFAADCACSHILVTQDNSLVAIRTRVEFGTGATLRVREAGGDLAIYFTPAFFKDIADTARRALDEAQL
jgi:hypothetical protein